MSKHSFLVPRALLSLLLLAGTFPALGGVLLLDERISLDLKDAPVRDIFGVYRSILDVELDFDPAIDGSIDITFANITVRTSLDAVCESAGCRWEWLDGDPPLLRVTRDPGGWTAADVSSADRSVPSRGTVGSLDSPVTLKLDDADVAKVFETVALLLNARVLLDKNVGHAKVTLHRDELPISDLLDDVCLQVGCTWSFTAGDDPVLGVQAAE